MVGRCAVSGCEINGWSDGKYVIGSLNGSGDAGSRYLLKRISDGIRSDGDRIGVVPSFLNLFIGKGFSG